MSSTAVAALAENPKAKEVLNQLQDLIEKDTVANAIMEKAQDFKDMYEVVKRYVDVKLEQFKSILQDTLEYFSSQKTALSDDVLECVAGGSWFSDAWNWTKRNWKAVVTMTVGVAAAAVGCALTLVAAPVAVGFAGLALTAGGIITACVGSSLKE